MRASVLVAGVAVLAGVGLIARSGEHAPADGRIIVVRGGAAAAPPLSRLRTELRSQALGAGLTTPAPESAASETAPDAGVWATPAEFDQPEPPA